MTKALSVKHLLGIKDLTVDDISLIFETAANFKDVINRPIKKVPSLRDTTVANLFSKILPAPASPLSWQKNDYRPTSSTSPPPPHR